MVPDNNRKLREKNLSALAKIDSSLAEKIGGVSFPEDMRFTEAVDGSDTVFGSTLSRSGWFAGTSAPSVREQVMVENFSPGRANVLLPGTGQGIGIKLLLEKLEPYQAIFVWEQNLLNIAIVFALYDFSEAIEAGRIVFLIESDIGKCLREYFSRHGEYAFPTKVLHWPWITEKKMQEISLQIERAVSEVAEGQRKRIAELESEFSEKAASSIKKNNIYIVSFAQQSEYFRLARSIESAIRAIGFEVKSYLLDTPRHGTHITLLEELVEFLPSQIISIAMPKSRWPIKLPKEIKVISVLSPPTGKIDNAQLEQLELKENEIFVVGSQDDAEALKKRISQDKVFAFDIAVDDLAFKPLEEFPVIDVAIFADRPEDNPERYGIKQSSHKRLWTSLKDAISKQALTFHTNQTEEIVRKMCVKTGVEFNDEELFDSFVSLVKQFLAPSVVASTIAGKIIHSSLKAEVFGRGWDMNVRILPAEPEEINKIFNSAKLIVIIDNETYWREIVFDAICAGSIVVAKPIPEDKLSLVKEISEAVMTLDDSRDIIAQLKDFLKDYEQLKARAVQAGKFLSSHYSLQGFFKQFTICKYG